MKNWQKILSCLVTILVPMALIFLGVRPLLSHAFLEIEYRMPDFPEEPYGFTLEDRLHWSRYAVDYLIGNAGIEYLGDLTFADGTPLFNARELSHMEDVRGVVQPFLWFGTGVWVLLALLGISARLGGWWQGFLRGLRSGGLLVLSLAIVIGVFAAISFWEFFTLFHALFFSGDSWMFFYSDTLIRLFPLRFWQDAVIFIGFVVVGGGLALVLLIRKRKEA